MRRSWTGCWRGMWAGWVAQSLERARRELYSWTVGLVLPHGCDVWGMLKLRHGSKFNFCVVVDEVCLESLVYMEEPVVKVVWKDGVVVGPEEVEDEMTDECGVVYALGEDAGWSYVEVGDYVEWYDFLSETEWWYNLYMRPPGIGQKYHIPEDKLPGYWREQTMTLRNGNRN